ncbi:MAG TPA: methyltransferase domain-containing protein, partial [Chthoniobacterales bacterium]|nr:methyltransferase domain-containing protein [Chthoniobacterales bacterium]
AVLDHHYFKALDRFDLRFARTMWVYDNVGAKSSVLDLGCGAGILALLKRKDVTLVGVDLSDECVAAARRNGYDETIRSELKALPFADGAFDYVVSLDVIGHIPAEDKDAVLQEIRRVLKPGGVTMHGIECTDHDGRRRYDEMNEEELRRFIAIDGHVGLEEEEEHAARFRRFFKHVAWQPRYALCLSSDEFQKQADRYGLPFEDDFLEYLRGLSFAERRAFDMAMGYVFSKISDLDLRLPRSGLYTFLKASDAPLGPFNNEHRDRRALFALEKHAESNGEICLDRAPHAVFDDGWYEPDDLPPIARWLKRRGRVRFQARAVQRIKLDLTTHLPELEAHPIEVTFSLDGNRVASCTLFRYGWVELDIRLPEPVLATEDRAFELEITANQTWQPRPTDPENRDDRLISIAVCNLRCS